MKPGLCVYIVFISTFCFSQNKELLFNFTDIPQSLLLNPGARVSFNKHLGVPLLSQFHFNVGIKGASVYDVFADNNTSINTKIENTLRELTRNDFVTVTQQLELFSIGWRSKKWNNKLYFSAGAYQETDLITYIPKDFAVLAYSGNRDFLNESFKLSDISFTGELLMVYHAGLTMNINEKFTLGARGKLYSSMFSFRSTNNRGTFITTETPEGQNFYVHQLRNIDVTVQTAGYASLLEINAPNSAVATRQIAKQFIKRGLLGGNLGLGLDLGATYKIDPQWTLTGSILDVGFIHYTKDTEVYEAKGNYAFIGFEAPVNDVEGQDLLDELEAAIPIDTLSKTYTSLRPVKLNSSLSYAFNQKDQVRCYTCKRGEAIPYQDELGLQLFSQFRPRRPIFGVSLFYSKRITDLFHLKTTYTMDDYSLYNLGFLFSTYIYGFNFYIAGNHLLEYRNLAKARGVSVQLGFNIIL